jgi:hypothetical protein
MVVLGSKYGVDPNFFAQVLDFGPSQGSFAAPSLPAATWNVLRIPVMTVLSRSPATKATTPGGGITGLRASGAVQMKKYHRRLTRYYDADKAADPIPVGSRYVRNYHVLDETHSAIEQSIHIYVQPASDGIGWVGSYIRPWCLGLFGGWPL